MSCPYCLTNHPARRSPIPEQKLLRELHDCCQEAGIEGKIRWEFLDELDAEHALDPRRYAQVDPFEPCFEFSRAILYVPDEQRRGIIMHEIGHVLDPKGSEDDADAAVGGIDYDERWPGKGLQTKNPPYSGWRKGWWEKPLPPDTHKLSYQTKRDALNVFLDFNRGIIDDYGGEDMKHSAASFDAINHKFDIKGKRKVDTIAKAVWWSMPAGSPYYLEDLDVELLNRTAPTVYNPRGLSFALPDYAAEAELLAKEAEHWERYAGVEYPDEDAPF